MTERPIPFRDWEVRAILKGDKTLTRRIVKPQPWVDDMGNAVWKDTIFGQNSVGVPHIQSLASPVPSSRTKRVLCPYGAPGDLLWVRETWAPLKSGSVDFAADWSDTQKKFAGKWRPSIHMPRWASRITLEVKSVRVERLQDISEDDARAEGVHRTDWEYDDGECCDNDRDALRALWNHINGPDAWEANPWVWALSFERVTP